LLYLLLIILLSLTAVYAKKPTRRRATTDMARALWLSRSRNNDQSPTSELR